MVQYNVFDKTTKESKEFYSLSEAKKHMKKLIKEGHECYGSKTRIYSNGDWEHAGEITLTGSNKTFIANTRQKKPGY